MQKMTTPPSDVLTYTLEDESWIAVRPSGTEPKIKFLHWLYKGNSSEDAANKNCCELEAPLMKLQKFKR